MNNQEKLNDSITYAEQIRIRYRITFSTDTVHNSNIFFHFHSLVSFLFLFSSLVSFAFCLCVFINKNIYCDTHRLCGRVTDKKFFTRPISQNKITFFFSYFLGISADKKFSFIINNDKFQYYRIHFLIYQSQPSRHYNYMFKVNIRSTRTEQGVKYVQS